MALRQPLTKRNRWRSSLDAIMAIHLTVPVMMFMELDFVQEASTVLSTKVELSLVYVTVFY